MPADHPHHVALWLAEVFGGPAEYSEHHGGYAHMVAKHIGLSLTEPQRARWVQLIGLAADDAGLPSDPEFRSAFIAYIECQGSREPREQHYPFAWHYPQPPSRVATLSGISLREDHCELQHQGHREADDPPPVLERNRLSLLLC